MKKLFIMSAAALFAASVPALAQVSDPATKPAGQETSLADCQANWNRADVNGDGMLSRSEISEAKPLIPTTLGGTNAISKTDFMSACEKSERSSKE